MPGLRAKVTIALVNKDVEDILHAKYADNRIVNEDYKPKQLNGFALRKFDEFIASVDKVFLLTSPCILWCKTFLKTKNIRLNDTTEWELSQNKFGYYFRP
jgi:hypothetical protein